MQKSGNFYNLSFESKLKKVLVHILSLVSGSVDLHIFADPDPGSQNIVDTTDSDPEPKHWNIQHIFVHLER